MMPNLLVTMCLEAVLNSVLYSDRALKGARQRLEGKRLQLHVKDALQPLILVFNSTHIHVFTLFNADESDPAPIYSKHSENLNPELDPSSADALVKMPLSVLPHLRHRDQLLPLIREGKLEVEGDIELVQHFSALIELAEWDPAEFLAPWTGDVFAQGFTDFVGRTVNFFRADLAKKRDHLTDLVKEEWRLVLGKPEVKYFAERIAELEQATCKLQKRLATIEKTKAALS